MGMCVYLAVVNLFDDLSNWAQAYDPAAHSPGNTAFIVSFLPRVQGRGPANPITSPDSRQSVTRTPSISSLATPMSANDLSSGNS